MEFQLTQQPTRLWEWTLMTKEKLIARSPVYFATEEAARSHIAAAKTAMKGARFAKVVVK